MNKLLMAMLLLLSVLPARAADVAGIFREGSTQFSLIAGGGTAFNNNYTVLGAGISHYVVDGVSVGLSYENWSGGTPSISIVSPSVQYVFYQADPVKPYVGVFYRHAFVSGGPSFNSAGARVGFYFATSRRSVVGLGVAYESYLNCRSSVYSSCSETYPEISIVFAF